MSSASFAVYCALHSKLFLVQTVEVDGSMEHPPLGANAIIKIAAVPTGRVSLFSLDLARIEKRLLANEWIHHVTLQMKPRHVLKIYVSFKEPKALLQTKKGTLVLVDAEGKAFGSASLAHTADLTLLSGFSTDQTMRIRDALALIATWESSGLGAKVLISSIHWDEDRGFRILSAYSMGNHTSQPATQGILYSRSMIDFGFDLTLNLDAKLGQLAKVFNYLSERDIAARQVWADAGKKIVVKTLRGS
jgi:hypothetical protein